MTSRFDSGSTAVQPVTRPPNSFSGSFSGPGFKTLVQRQDMKSKLLFCRILLSKPSCHHI